MALTLGRKSGEKVFIEDEHGRNIEVEVIRAERNVKHALKLRITAPQEFNIVRGEIYNGNNS
ncbi:carbon storage regulator, CsrA [Lentibacillus halodurans]|uniref:Carbon storage regulator, CsrA n=1 Tax=Lentibacillus halodurans TaxID=237679 RepID=A0A1I0Y5Y0_9BACI|nr:carbon storage regulator [Lentibacillus halodurans]SFB08642.1 carbon storage regulator, CsrA [Lentibacillus halodurans]